MELPVDFIAVVEHRLIPARVRGEWARLRAEGSASGWAPVSQESSHVGHAGVGVVSMRSAHFHSSLGGFFDCGRALRCMLPVASDRFLHFVVLYGYQGADNDAEQLALTEQLFDAASGKLGVVALDQPCWLETSMWNPPKSLAWKKGFRLGSGLTWNLLGPAAGADLGGKVVQMIKSAEGSAGLLHKITKPTAWRGGTQILKKEEYARLLDRCEAKRKEWAKHWQCDENVQILKEIGGSAAKDKGVWNGKGIETVQSKDRSREGRLPPQGLPGCEKVNERRTCGVFGKGRAERKMAATRLHDDVFLGSERCHQ